MFASTHNLSAYLPNEILESIFKSLAPKELGACSSVCKAWKSVADQEKFWAIFVTDKKGIQGLGSKQNFINQNKTRFFSVFSKELISALGGIEKIKELPLLNFNEPRVLSNGVIQISELSAPLTVGRLSCIPMSKKNKSIEPSDISRYTFLAIRFINREFDSKCQDKDVNIWITKEKSESERFWTESSWSLISGGNIGGWPTRFPTSDDTGDDFSRTIEYISRLVQNEPCGIRDICSPIEHSRITLLGTSTVSLA